MRAPRPSFQSSFCSLAIIVALVSGAGCKDKPDRDVTASPPQRLTEAQTRAGRDIGLLSGRTLQPIFFDLIANAPFATDDNITTTTAINDAGTIAGYTQHCRPPAVAGCPASPFFADATGGEHLLPNASGASEYVVDVNQNDDMLGFGGEGTNGNNDFLKPAIFHTDGSYDLLYMPRPIWVGSDIRMWGAAINDLNGANALPTVAATAIYLHSGTLAAWHLDRDAVDAVGPSSFTLPANPQWIDGRNSPALNLDGNVCLSLPTGNDTMPYFGGGVTMMAWVKPDAAACPGNTGTVVSRRYEYEMAVGCNGTDSANLSGQVVNTTVTLMPPIGSLPFGEWSHVAVSSDYKTIRAYVNGALVGEQPVGGQVGPWTDVLSLGCNPARASSGFHGGLDEVAIFDVPMAADQVALFARGANGYRASMISHQWARHRDGVFDVVLAPSDPAYTGFGVTADINNRGQMVGFQTLTAGTTSAMLYDPDTGWENLNDRVPGAFGWDLQKATKINNADVVIGTGTHEGRPAAFRLDLDTNQLVDLGHKTEGIYVDPRLPVAANDINNKGHVAGAIYEPYFFWPERAFVYTDEYGFTDLNSLIDPGLGWTLRAATAINDQDDIVGVAQQDSTGLWRGFKLSASLAQIAQDDGAAGIVPRVEGIAADSAGRIKAIFRYHNAAAQNTNVPYGTNNSLADDGGFIVAPVDQPPVWFATGDSGKPFVATLTGSLLTWTVGGHAATATTSSPSLEVFVSPNGVRRVELADGTAVPLDSETPDFLANAIGDTQPSSGPGTAVGRSEGAFEVTDDGSASYRIPLWLPEGRNGVAPRLALAYDSRGVDGPLGLGWRLDGLSTITRCKQDHARDGVSRGVRFDDSDRLCIDGQRLVLVAGTYNQTGAEYRTEEDAFAKIVQVGTDLNGPTGFLVYLKDGTRRSYGNASTSLAGYRGEPTAVVQGHRADISAPGNTNADATVTYVTFVRLSWQLASQRDRYDNEIRYHYVTPDQTPGNKYAIDLQPDRIDYTFSNAGAADRRIAFVYDFDEADIRHDYRDSYVGGLHLRGSRLLRKIQVFGPNPMAQGMLREYRLGYQNELGKRALLTSFRECDGSGICKNPTQFQWTDSDPTFRAEGMISPVGVGRVWPVDVNGDGRDDLVFRKFEDAPADPNRPFRWFYALARAEAGPDGNRFDDPVAFGEAGLFSDGGESWAATAARFGDLDMDGKTDMFYPIGAIRRYRVLRGDSFTPFDPSGTDPDELITTGDEQRVYIGDFDGDGLPDAMRALTDGSQDHWAFRIGTPNGLSSRFDRMRWPTIGGLVSVNHEANSYAIDLDGDGKGELLFPLLTEPGDPQSGLPFRMTVMDQLRDPATSAAKLRGVSLRSSSRIAQAGQVVYNFADVNGDGLVDAIEVPHTDANIRVAINDGLDFLPPVTITVPDNAKLGWVGSPDAGDDFHVFDNGTRLMDFDGDGRTDLFLMGAGCPYQHHDLTVLQARPGTAFEARALPYTVAIDPGPACGGGSTGSHNIWDRSVVLDVNGDGLMDFVQIDYGAPDAPYKTFVRNGVKPNLLRRVTDGFHHTVDISYAPLTDASVHTPATASDTDAGPACAYPQYCAPRGSTWVVSRHQLDAAEAFQVAYKHTYTGARTDLTGRGWLGFYRHTVEDLNRHQVTETLFERYNDSAGSKLYPLVGKPTRRTVTTPLSATGFVITETTTTEYTTTVKAGGALVATTPHVVTLKEIEEDADGNPGIKRLSVDTTTYDTNFGYLRSKKTECDGETEETTFGFDADRPDVWLIGLVNRKTVAYTTPFRAFSNTPGETVVRTSAFVNDPTTGALAEAITEPDGNESTYLRTFHQRNQNGQIIVTTQTRRDGAARPLTVEYDGVDGIFVARTINALGQITQTVTHPGLGLPVRTVDPNGFESRKAYDRLGKLMEERRPDGSIRSRQYDDLTEEGFPFVTLEQDRGRATVSYQDLRGKEVVTSVRDESNHTQQAEVAYDAYGHVTDRWRPHAVPLAAETPLASLPHTHNTYDELGRQTSETLAPFHKTWTYLGNNTTRSVDTETGTVTDDALADMRARVIHRVEHVTDGTGLHAVPTHNVYGPFGVLRDVIDNKGNVFHFEYDVRGRRALMRDPDAGTVHEAVDAFDQIVSRTNADGQTTTFTYDPLGRLTADVSEGGANVNVWDLAPNGIGQLAGTLSQDDVIVSYAYDARGLRTSETWKSAAGETFRFDYGYDGIGRLSSTQYPDVNGARYTIHRNYVPLTGELDSVTDDAGAVIFRVTGRNAERKITNATFGDGAATTRGYEPERGVLTSITTTRGAAQLQQLGYHYDRRGYMDARTSYLEGDNESFVHDELGRLTNWSSNTWQVRYGYDDIGNMLTRENLVGGVSQQLTTYTPGGADHPHAVASMTTNGETVSYGYDHSGRQISGRDRTVDYTHFDLPRSITHAGSTFSFGYTADHKRASKYGPDGVTIYANDLYERRTANGVVTHVMYIAGEAGGVVAQMTAAGGGAPAIAYLHDDHIGSVDVAGDVQVKFDPFGSRLGATAPPMSGPNPAPDVTRGFAGQEHDDALGLINMKGRIYDPELARFLTPDPLVGKPDKSQGWNRYSYTRNSPLMLNDPTGLSEESGDDIDDYDDEEEDYYDADTEAERLEEMGIDPTMPPGLDPSDNPQGAATAGNDDQTSGGAGAMGGNSAKDGTSTSGSNGRDGNTGIKLAALAPGYVAAPAKTATDSPPIYGPLPPPKAQEKLNTTPAAATPKTAAAATTSLGPLSALRLPDFIHLNISVTIPTPWTGTLLQWSGSVSVSRYGDFFWSPLGGGVGGGPYPVSASLSANWMLQADKPSQSQMQSYLSGHGVSFGGGYWAGGNFSFSPSTLDSSIGAGLYTPGAGATYNYSFQNGNVGRQW